MRAKRSLIIAAALGGGLALAAAAVLNPAVQTWAARRLLSSSALAQGSLGRVSLGMRHARIEALRLQADGVSVVVPMLEADTDVISAGLGRGYRFRTLVARGWTLDLTRPNGRAPARVDDAVPWLARAIGGMLAAFNGPAHLSVDGVDLEGDVIIPDAQGRAAARAHVVITGGGLSPGLVGRFLCRADAVIEDASAPVSSIAVAAGITAGMDASGTFTQAAMRADATANGRQFPGGVGLSCVASAARAAGKNSYSAALLKGAQRVAAIDAESPDGSLKVSGTWRLDVKDTDLAPFALGRTLPEFYIDGSGGLAVDGATGDVQTTGKLHASADRLGVLAAGLESVGRVALAADFDVARMGASLRVVRLETSLSGATLVGSARSLQSFDFNPASGELKVAVPSGDLVGISIAGVPLAWLRSSLPGVTLEGADAKGEFVMRAEDGRLALRTKAPLVATGVSVAQSGRILASGLELSAFILADYAPQGWQVQLAPFAVRSEGIKMFSLEARFGRLSGSVGTIKAAGGWSASLPALLSLPAAARMPRFTGGDLSGSFAGSLGSTREVEMKLALKNLVPAAGGEPAAALPAITADFRADFDAAGHVTFSLPVRLDYGARAADIALSGSVRTEPRGPVVLASLVGTRLLDSDVAALGIFAGGGDPGTARATPPAAAEAPRDTPFWPAVRGKLSVKVDGISVQHLELHDVRATLLLESASLAVESGSALVGQAGAARFGGELRYTAGAERPYALSADVAVDSVDSGPLFRAIEPGRPPLVEGRFDITAHVVGSGRAVRDVADHAQGNFKLSSKDGVFRALRTDIADTIRQVPSKIVDALDSVTTLFGRKPEKIGLALVETANGLSEIHYDQMIVTAQRGADLDLRVTEINLIAPEERLKGTGRIAYAEGVPLEDQALSIDVDLGVRGHLGKFMDAVGVLKDGQDELGYTPLYQTIHLGGSLRKIDQSQWKDMLVQASLRKGGGLFDKLLGR